MSLKDHFKEYWPHYILIGGNAALATISFFYTIPSNTNITLALTLWLFFLILSVVGTIFKIRHDNSLIYYKNLNVELNKKISVFENDIENLKTFYKEIINTYLMTLNDKLQFTNSERISIFIQKNNHFLLLGRYSLNENFKKAGRAIYSIEQGCLGKAWENGECLANLPEYKNKKGNNTRYLSTCNKDFLFSEDEVRNLTMKSSSLYGKALNNYKSKREAVILFESMKSAFDIKQLLYEKLTEKDFEMIKLFIDQFDIVGSDPLFAKKEGF